MGDNSSPNREEIKRQLTKAKAELSTLKKQKTVLEGIYKKLAAPESDFNSGIVKAIPKIDDDLSWKGDTRRSFDKKLNFIQLSYAGLEKNSIIPVRKTISSDIRSLSNRISELERKIKRLSFSLNNPLFRF